MAPTRGSATAQKVTPLGDVEWQIVLALADGPKHGYGILLEIEEREGVRGAILPGSLYRALHRLEKERLVEERDDDSDASAERPRKRFDLTPAGRRVAEAEARRLLESIRTARRKGLLPDGSAT